MRTNLLLSLFLAVVVGCTKPNPNRCCIDEADCAAAGLPVGMTCNEGRVCRGNVCIEESCETANECDLAAPYCVMPPGGACSDRCTEDSQCPGKGQPTEAQFCVSDECVECRAANDCSGATPVCKGGLCMSCAEHDQCASGVCKDGGQCAAETEIAYVNAIGLPTSDCTAASPCSTIERALAFATTRPYVVVNPGTYNRTGPLTLASAHWIVGRGTPRPVIDRIDDGPIFYIQGSANAHLEQLELTGATGLAVNGDLVAGYAILCKKGALTPTLSLRSLSVHDVERGVASRGCIMSVVRSTFVNAAIELVDTSATLDANVFTGSNVSLDAGLFTFTNNYVARVPSGGLAMYLPSTGNVVAFNTIVDARVLCEVVSAQAFPNNIVARSGDLPVGTMCSFPGTIVAPTDLTALKFKHPDSAPYDYHLMPGSSAIDAAVGTSSLNHDIDGEARPKGAGRDVGADEAQ